MQRESSRQPTRETEKAVLSELESLVSSKQLPHKCRALGRDRIELDTLNPKCFDAFLDAFDIDSHLTLSIKVAETEAPLDYLSLQREQNKEWARTWQVQALETLCVKTSGARLTYEKPAALKKASRWLATAAKRML
nr:hypothetical protein HK105_004219 [Polyrhizophydium stewartii]